MAEIAEALRACGADALVYLVPADSASAPPDGAAPGYALLLGADGTRESVELPGLTTAPDGTVDLYTGCHSRARTGVTAENRPALGATATPGDPAPGREAEAEWRAALDGLCDWAWQAAMGPVLDRVTERELGAAGRPPRLILVPCGTLGVVPWHAARTVRGDGRLRYACEMAVFSYATTARQLVEVTGRPVLDPRTAAVIVAPDGELGWSQYCAGAIRNAFYPGAAAYWAGSGDPAGIGTAGIGTPAEVLGWLPGTKGTVASLLHLGCHARVQEDPMRSHVQLAAPADPRKQGDETPQEDPRWLTVGTILRQGLHREPKDPGGTIVLTACVSDLTDRDHDEALTLATALLAAGNARVIGSRWEVLEVRTSILIFMFHYFLDQLSGKAPDALRAAQLWMLDPDREIPPSMPPLLADEVQRAAVPENSHELDLASVYSWAAFTHHGR